MCNKMPCPATVFYQRIRSLNGYKLQMDVGLFSHYTVSMVSAWLGCLFYGWISVIYEVANCLCPDCVHDRAIYRL